LFGTGPQAKACGSAGANKSSQSRGLQPTGMWEAPQVPNPIPLLLLRPNLLRPFHHCLGFLSTTRPTQQGGVAFQAGDRAVIFGVSVANNTAASTGPIVAKNVVKLVSAISSMVRQDLVLTAKHPLRVVSRANLPHWRSGLARPDPPYQQT